MKTISAKKFNSNSTLSELVEPENDLKNFLVEYVGEEVNPTDGNVTLEMIVDVVAAEFPEFLLAIAEENWIRGYQQALDDVDVGREFVEKEDKNDRQRKSCKLCETEE